MADTIWRGRIICLDYFIHSMCLLSWCVANSCFCPICEASVIFRSKSFDVQNVAGRTSRARTVSGNIFRHLIPHVDEYLNLFMYRLHKHKSLKRTIYLFLEKIIAVYDKDLRIQKWTTSGLTILFIFIGRHAIIISFF